MVEKVCVNAGQHALIIHGSARYVVDSTTLYVLGRLFEGTLEAGTRLGEAWCLVETMVPDELRAAVVEKVVARAVAQARPVENGLR